MRAASGEEWPLKLAPKSEQDAFVIFDQNHCRGSDMKLRPTAKAVLSLGPKMGKDELVQAAGRLRRLGGQTIVITAMPEVHTLLTSFCNAGYTDATQRPSPNAKVKAKAKAKAKAKVKVDVRNKTNPKANTSGDRNRAGAAANCGKQVGTSIADIDFDVEVTVLDILKWVMWNTMNTSQSRLLE